MRQEASSRYLGSLHSGSDAHDLRRAKVHCKSSKEASAAVSGPSRYRLKGWPGFIKPTQSADTGPYRCPQKLVAAQSSYADADMKIVLLSHIDSNELAALRLIAVRPRDVIDRLGGDRRDRTAGPCRASLIRSSSAPFCSIKVPKNDHWAYGRSLYSSASAYIFLLGKVQRLVIV
jgi:hypothetical protein